MSKLRIKKGDQVVVIAGAWKSEEPKEVLQVLPEADRVLVQDVNKRFKHEKRSQQNPQGGRIEKEFPIHLSNVQLYSPKAKKGVRSHMEMIDGKRIRVGHVRIALR